MSALITFMSGIENQTSPEIGSDTQIIQANRRNIIVEPEVLAYIHEIAERNLFLRNRTGV